MLLKKTLFLLLCYCLSTHAQETIVQLYRPLTETTKQPPVAISEKKNGTCWQQSHQIKREDAWRCVADNVTYDPCFVPRFGKHTEAFCIASPWETTGIAMEVATPLDNSNHEILDMSRTLPWAVELTSGETCRFIETPQQVDGLPIYYQCNQHSQLIGHMQRCTNEWKMLQHRYDGITTAQISRAWF